METQQRTHTQMVTLAKMQAMGTTKMRAMRTRQRTQKATVQPTPAMRSIRATRVTTQMPQSKTPALKRRLAPLATIAPACRSYSRAQAPTRAPVPPSGTTVGFSHNFALSCEPMQAPDVVYWITPDVAGRLTIDTVGSDFAHFDPVIAVRSVCDSAASEFGCDQTSAPNPDHLTVPVYANATYYVIVSGTNSTGGAYR